MESAILVKRHLNKLLFSLPKGAARGITARILRLDWENFSKWSNGKWQPRDFKSSEVGVLKSSRVQPTTAISESISNLNVNLSFCT
jgi:hypothetical protein